MAGIVRPKRGYAERRAAFDEKRRMSEAGGGSGAADGASSTEPTSDRLAEASPPVRVEVAPAPEPPTLATPEVRSTPPTAGVRTGISRGPATSDPAGTVVRFHVPAPAPGVFPFFDKASAEMGELRALQRILARALGKLAEEVDAGHPIAPATYPASETRFHTSRNLSPALHAAAKAAFDPLDLETAAELGRRLGMTAIARYLEALG